MRTNTASDLDMFRRMIRETESMFGLAQDLCDEEDNLPTQELQDGLVKMVDAIIQYRCAIDAAWLHGPVV